MCAFSGVILLLPHPRENSAQFVLFHHRESPSFFCSRDEFYAVHQSKRTLRKDDIFPVTLLR